MRPPTICRPAVATSQRRGAGCHTECTQYIRSQKGRGDNNRNSEHGGDGITVAAVQGRAEGEFRTCR